MSITMENLEKLEQKKETKLGKEAITTICLGVSIVALLIQVAFVFAVKTKITELVDNNAEILYTTNELKSKLLERNKLYAEYIVIDTNNKIEFAEKEKLKHELLQEIKKRR